MYIGAPARRTAETLLFLIAYYQSPHLSSRLCCPLSAQRLTVGCCSRHDPKRRNVHPDMYVEQVANPRTMSDTRHEKPRTSEEKVTVFEQQQAMFYYPRRFLRDPRYVTADLESPTLPLFPVRLVTSGL